eukprot:1155998-Pelagomonas_calceolata.AAC.10
MGALHMPMSALNMRNKLQAVTPPMQTHMHANLRASLQMEPLCCTAGARTQHHHWAQCPTSARKKLTWSAFPPSAMFPSPTSTAQNWIWEESTLQRKQLCPHDSGQLSSARGTRPRLQAKACRSKRLSEKITSCQPVTS